MEGLALTGGLSLANTIRINGVTIASGRNITITDGRVVIDGRDVTPDGKTITIEVVGDVDRLEVDACDEIAISGSAGSISTQTGDVACGGVSGSVSTMSGDVECGDIGGSVQTMSGDVTFSGRVSGGARSISGRVRGA